MQYLFISLLAGCLSTQFNVSCTQDSFSWVYRPIKSIEVLNSPQQGKHQVLGCRQSPLAIS